MDLIDTSNPPWYWMFQTLVFVEMWINLTWSVRVKYEKI